jgi:hypothetical protein
MRKQLVQISIDREYHLQLLMMAKKHRVPMSVLGGEMVKLCLINFEEFNLEISHD